MRCLLGCGFFDLHCPVQTAYYTLNVAGLYFHLVRCVSSRLYVCECACVRACVLACVFVTECIGVVAGE